MVIPALLFSLSCSSTDSSNASPDGSAANGTGGGAVGSGGRNGTGGATGSGGHSSGGTNGSSGGAIGTGGHAGSGGNTAGSGGTGNGDAGPDSGDAGSGEGGPVGSCGGHSCKSGEVCVASRTVGGGLIFPEAGLCPTGSHVEKIAGSGTRFCAADYDYACRTLVGCTGTAVSCTCGASTCPVAYSCVDPQPGAPSLDPSAELVCEERVP